VITYQRRRCINVNNIEEREEERKNYRKMRKLWRNNAQKAEKNTLTAYKPNQWNFKENNIML
jgi:hypothetical protein